MTSYMYMLVAHVIPPLCNVAFYMYTSCVSGNVIHGREEGAVVLNETAHIFYLVSC